jgi:hypothetical protein
MQNKKSDTTFIANYFEALDHVQKVHSDLARIHCYLCGLAFEKELYQQHLYSYLTTSEKSKNEDEIVINLLGEQRRVQKSSSSLTAEMLESDDQSSSFPLVSNQQFFTDRIICIDKAADVFQCGICLLKKDTKQNIRYHLHTKCFPRTGAPCIDCQKNGNKAPILKEYSEILRHNNEFHQIKRKWTCVFCYQEIRREQFDAHFSNNANTQIAPFVFDDSCIGKITIGSRKIPLEKILQKASRTISHK